eukprot:scaffold17.g430.t1
MATLEKQRPEEEPAGEQASGLLSRIAGTFGLTRSPSPPEVGAAPAAAPEGRPVEVEAPGPESVVTTTTTIRPAEGAPVAPAALAEEEVEVGMERPQFSTSTELPTPPELSRRLESGELEGGAEERALPPTTGTQLGPVPEQRALGGAEKPAWPEAQGAGAAPAPAQVVLSPATPGARSGGAAPEESLPLTPTSVEALPPGVPAEVAVPAAAAARLEAAGAQRRGVGEHAALAAGGAEAEAPVPPIQVEVRPSFEAEPMSAVEVTEMKAREHQLAAAEREQVVSSKEAQMEQLRRQARMQEAQSESLTEEAARAQAALDQTLEQKRQVEQVEWRHYADAERAETERRKVVAAARPAAHDAAAAEMRAMQLQQQAADTMLHAEVLESRAKALMQEAAEMAVLARDQEAEAEAMRAHLLIKKQEVEEWEHRMAQARGVAVTSGDLPTYIEARAAPPQRHSHKGIDWARLEMERLHGEGSTWERVLTTKRSEAGVLMVRAADAHQASLVALEREVQARVDADERAALAERKYEEALALETEAKEEQALADRLRDQASVALGRAGPAQQLLEGGQQALREAAELEHEAKAIEAEAQAQRMEQEVVTHKEMAQSYTAQQAAHRASAASTPHAMSPAAPATPARVPVPAA